MHRPRSAVGLKEVPVHWADICRVMRIMGLMEDLSEGECQRIASMLEKRTFPKSNGNLPGRFGC